MDFFEWIQHSSSIVLRRLWDTFKITWLLGFTAFGGPPVHFKIFYEKYIIKLKWIEEQIYQELFSITQAISCPASTKILYCINLIHGGTLSAVTSFLIWSNSAVGMYALSLGVSTIGSTLPAPAYALLSGLNAATVGVIALAAVQLSERAITDQLTRILVFLSAIAGLLYDALWYFPLLMFLASFATVIFDYRWLHRSIGALIQPVLLGRWLRRDEQNIEQQGATSTGNDAVMTSRSAGVREMRSSNNAPQSELSSGGHRSRAEVEPRVIPDAYHLNFSWKVGTIIVGIFFISFTVIMVVRGALLNAPLLYRLFANMYLAGTIIFGGGPVAIPLLREYIVAEGWVSPRNFLIGLAIIQAFPGPNFNFAVFLGSLTTINGGLVSVAGAVIGFIVIFVPGLVLVHGTMGVCGAIRGRRWVKSGLRGTNAGAVGLIYTAIYRLWQMGYIDETFQSGVSLGNDPWWVVVSSTSYVGGRWFGISPPFAIVLGAGLGLIKYGIVSHN
ncbi:chromate transporter-domain-containing protein [Xylariales sp. PMI_506]|nr:chromate transporter-domain-containing protein [Xylariales sp. PMI_506]